MLHEAIALNIDDSLVRQTQLLHQLPQTVDLQHLEHALRLWASRQGLKQFREKLQALPPARRLTFLGSGDYHHLSAALIENLPDDCRPLHLILIDNHPDWFVLPPRYHCGNWVSGLLRYPWIASVTLIGQDSDDLAGHQFWLAPFNDLCSGRIHLHPYRRKNVFVPLKWPASVLGAKHYTRQAAGTQLQFETLQTAGNVQKLAAIILKRLAGKNVYISIDKDCLHTRFAATDWEQGQFCIDDVCELVRLLKSQTRLIGADVCGERAPRPLAGSLKRLDAGRFNVKPEAVEKQTADAILNESTNLALLAAFMTA